MSQLLQGALALCLLLGLSSARSPPQTAQAALQEVLFVIGGEQLQVPTTDVQVIDFSGQGLPCRTPGSLPAANDQEFAFANEEGGLMACGGEFQGKKCLSYDPIANEWVDNRLTLTTPRYDGAVITLPDARVWFIGGLYVATSVCNF